MNENIYIFDACEENKNIENVLKIVDILLEKNFTKKNKLIVIGGGITQEIGGFVQQFLKEVFIGRLFLLPFYLLYLVDVKYL